MTTAYADVPGIIRDLDETLRRHAATPSALETLLQRRGAAAHVAGTPSSAPTGAIRGALQSKGISGAGLTATVAGVAVVGGAIYAMTRKPRHPAVGAWTDRVTAPQMSGPGGISMDR